MTWPVAFRGIESVPLLALREEGTLSLPLRKLCAPLTGDVAQEVAIPVDDLTFLKTTTT